MMFLTKQSIVRIETEQQHVPQLFAYDKEKEREKERERVAFAVETAVANVESWLGAVSFQNPVEARVTGSMHYLSIDIPLTHVIFPKQETDLFLSLFLMERSHLTLAAFELGVRFSVA